MKRFPAGYWLEIVVGLLLLVFLAGDIYWGTTLLNYDHNATGQTRDGLALERHDARDHQFTVYMCVTEGSDAVDTSVVLEDYPSTYLNLAFPKGTNPNVDLGFLQKYKDENSICGDRTYKSQQLALLPATPLLAFPINTAWGPPYPLNCEYAKWASAPSNAVSSEVADSVKRGFNCVLYPATSEGPVPISFQWAGAVLHRNYTDRSIELVIPPSSTTPSATVHDGKNEDEYPIRVVVFLPEQADVLFNPNGSTINAALVNNEAVRRIDMTIDARPYKQLIEVDWRDESLAASRDSQLLWCGVFGGVLVSGLLGLVLTEPRWHKR